jgi:hypothetical protein
MTRRINYLFILIPDMSKEQDKAAGAIKRVAEESKCVSYRQIRYE